ncbi:RAS2 protein [Entomophthora muscae]|uniref:RAS2 protein n=1 Tax=Entomophthora muscae TaxID=34485 RepID=A0ACC2SMF2_9FUNG|nr:RAS2 protein [Entomophthora muscae]
MGDVYKIVVLGDGGVGKTYDPTIEDSYRKQIVLDDEACIFEVLDTAGQEEYTALRDQWIRDGEGFVLVYSVTTRTTFERVEKFRDQVTRVKDTDSVPIVIVGNKCDAEDLREVPKDEGKSNAERLGCQFIEASAKTSYNIEEPFYTVARMIRAERRGESAAAIEEPEPKKKKGKCNIL